MTTTHAVRTIARTELLLFLREPFAVMFTLVMPLVLLLIFGSSFGEEPARDGYQVSDLLLPSLIAIVLSYVALGGLPIVFAEYREIGVFRAHRVTPTRSWAFSLAHVSVHVLMCLVAAATAAVVTWAVFGIRFGGNVATFLLVVAASTVALFGVGYLIASLPLGTRTAQAVGTGLYFAFIFTSGATMPRDKFPDWLAALTRPLPMTMIVDLFEDVWIGDVATGRIALSAIVLVGIGLLAAAAASRVFSP